MRRKKSTTLEWIAVAVTVVLLLGVTGGLAFLLIGYVTAQDTEPAPRLVQRDESAEDEEPAEEEPAESAEDEEEPAESAEDEAEEEPADEPTATPTETATSTPMPTPTPTTSVAYDPRFEPAPCPVETPPDAIVECGYLVVPEDRSEQDSQDARLAVAIIRSFAQNPAPDPMIYLEGGPGGTAFQTLDIWINRGFANQRDVIVLDQRGTGHSEPSLNCTEIEDWTYKYLGNPEWFLRNSTLRCRRRLSKEGVDLRVYNSATNAADVNDLRAALGYEQVNLLGISYGTKLALTTMRDYPEHIRSVVLDSTYPPNVDIFAEDAANIDRAFTTLFEGCAADASCNAAFPFLEDTFYTLVEDLNEEPVTVVIQSVRTGQPTRVTVTGDDLLGILFLTLYDTEAIPFLPRIIAESADGNNELLAQLAQIAFNRGYSTADGFSEGMYYSVQCNEEMPFVDYTGVLSATANYPRLEEYVLEDFELERVMCNFWGAGEAAPVENEPVVSAIPTLVLAGEYDPVTPPTWGQLAAETLSNSYYHEFPGFGHGSSPLGGCPTDITLAFLANPTVAPDASCIGGISGPDFSVP